MMSVDLDSFTCVFSGSPLATPEVAQIHAAAPGSRKNLSDKLKTGKVERWKVKSDTDG